MGKVCIECGEKLLGRSDKKYCNDYCRNAYNNKRNKDSNNLVRTVNNRLRRNYRILRTLNPDGKARITRSKLLNEGFDFECITRVYTTQKGSTYYFVYDLGYLPLENDMYMLVKKSV
ncbi:hypothetical protein [Robertkochia flava]|uniref:hypothetical protein n=1 Tax=Robertkochia flava TaxID=3447986 RepID=UPI001CCCDE78|nr:hypothetical protein [Robertkochia marina]